MTAERKIDFDIALNLMGLTPQNPDYWIDSLGRICANLANQHGIHARGWVGASMGTQAFVLFARPHHLDLDKPEDMKKYQEAEAKVAEVVAKYVKQ